MSTATATRTATIAESNGQKVTVSPGKSVVPLPANAPVPLIGVFEWQRAGADEYRPVVRVHETWVRLTEKLPRQLGMGIDYCTLKRLMRAGFVEWRQPGPRCLQINLKSWYEHVEATKDPEFWAPDGKNMRKWTEAFA